MKNAEYAESRVRRKEGEEESGSAKARKTRTFKREWCGTRTLFFGGGLNYVGGQGFQIGEGAAGGDAGFFEERGIEDEGAAVDEGMVGGCEGFARAATGAGAGDEVFVHTQVGLKVERFTDIPVVMARKRGQVFLTEGGRFFAGHGFRFCAIVVRNTPGDEFEGAGGESEEGFALEKIEKVAVEGGVDLQGVAAVFDDVGVDEVGDRAFAEEGIAEALGEGGSEVAGGGFRFRGHVKFL